MSRSSGNPPILILGCGRSGTSIFGELFEDLGIYKYYSEPHFEEMLTWFGSGVAAKVPISSERYPSDLGLSIQLAALFEKVPDTRLFWIVRHPLDAVCSLRIGIDQDWGHHPRPPDWQDWLGRPLVERCAHHWTYINSCGYDAVKDRAILVRFEDMIRAPYEFACRVLSRIGIPTDENVGRLLYWSGRIHDANNDDFVEAVTSRNYSRPDHTVRISRWRENLSNEEALSVIRVVADTNRRFGYELSGNGGQT